MQYNAKFKILLDIFRSKILYSLAIFILNPIFLFAEDARMVTIRFEELKGANFYEIEWLKTEQPNWKNPDKGDGLSQVVFSSPIKRNLPAEYRFFRIRSALEPGVFGKWSKVYEIHSQPKKDDAASTDLSFRDNKDNDAKKDTKPETKKNIDDDEKPSQKQNQKPDQKPSQNGSSDASKKPDPYGDQIDPSDPSNQNRGDRDNRQADDAGNDGTDKLMRQFYFPDASAKKEKKPHLRGSSFDLSPASQNDAQLYYQLNDGPRTKYQKPLRFSTPGLYTLRIINVFGDKKEESKEISFYVYPYPPRAEARIYPPFYFYVDRLVLGPQSRIELKANEGASVLYAVYRKKEPVKFIAYKGPLIAQDLVKESEDGVWLVYYAYDKIGRKSEVKPLGFIIDRKAPRVEINRSGDILSVSITELSIPVIVKIYDGAGALLFRAPLKNKDQIKIPEGAYRLEFTDQLQNKFSTDVPLPK